jgi:hypothetical protein
MPYHDLSRGKGLRLGQEYLLMDVETATEPHKKDWLNSLAALGCDRAVIG